MENDPIYYINQYSLLKRPAIWSKYEYWGAGIISWILAVLIFAGFYAIYSLTEANLIVFLATMTGVLLGSAYNHRKGRQRAERYKHELANGIPFYYGVLPPGSYGSNPP